MSLKRFPLIIGSTASGKTRIAVGLAKELERRGYGKAEVVSADSMTVYKELNIGTAKPKEEELEGVPHHLFSIISSKESYSVGQWLGAAKRTIEDIKGRGAIPIVCGGSHMYAKALLFGLLDEDKAKVSAIRARLDALPQEELRQRLKEVDPEAWERIHNNDRKRTLRALEVFEETGKTITSQQVQWDRKQDDNIIPIAIMVHNNHVGPVINKRVWQMLQDGLESEVYTLWNDGLLGPTARAAIGYKEFVSYFERRGLDRTRMEVVERIKINTRHLAKHQRVWLKRLSTIPRTLSIELRAKAIENYYRTGQAEHLELEPPVDEVVEKIVQHILQHNEDQKSLPDKKRNKE